LAIRFSEKQRILMVEYSGKRKEDRKDGSEGTDVKEKGIKRNQRLFFLLVRKRRAPE